MGNHFGKCALCRKECDLSFEHIPPRKAFNSSPSKPVSGDQLIKDDNRMPWDTAGLHYSNQQQGMGKYSLCDDCNNKTGAWYAPDYIFITKVIHSTISKPIPENVNGIGINEVYPLRFIKQVLSMFCSINNYDDPRIAPLREFILDRYATGIDKSKYKLCMYLTNSKLTKYAPLSVVMRSINNSYESMALSEITAYPLGFILYFNPTDTFHYDGFDITNFSDVQYDDQATIEFPLCILEMNDIFPTYYRSQEEIKQCVDENKKLRKNHKDGHNKI